MRGSDYKLILNKVPLNDKNLVTPGLQAKWLITEAHIATHLKKMKERTPELIISKFGCLH